jgi:hypothetical protein
MSLTSMRRPPLLAPALAALLSLSAAAAPSDAQTSGPDPAARGLDLFVHVPESAAPGATIPVQLEAFGFPTAVSLVPLSGATVEAGWDPEHLGPGISSAPPPIRATTDAAGHARLEVAVPEGEARALQLFVGIRSGSHERTRTVKIHRGPLHAVALHIADSRVVPGSSISAWVMVTRASTGEPAASAPIELALVEGGVPRHKLQLTTDAAGTAMARVPIPPSDEPAWSWQLRARSMGQGQKGAGEAHVKLTPREETPGSPRMRAAWAEDAVLAGDRVPFTIRVRDASDQPIAGLPIRYWIGPKGTEPPKDDAQWKKLAKTGTTDAEGELRGSADAPTLVMQGVGTTLRLVAKAEVEGHALDQTTTVSVGAPVSTAELLPEAGSIFPGVEQRLVLRVRDGRARPVSAAFSVRGDGLDGNVTTNADGEAELTWKPPADVGALRNVGPCAGGVAAAVTVRPVGEVPALRPRRDPFELCLRVDRDATALVVTDRPIARVGERVHVRVVEAPGEKGAKARPAGQKSAWSVVLRAGSGEQAASLWIEDGEQGADLVVPAGAPGEWSLSAASPATARPAHIAGGALLVTPRVLPVLAAKLAGGRAAPGGAVDVDVDLGDGQGHGLPGTVAAVVVDLHGGGSVEGLEEIDTRRSICRGLGVERARCGSVVDGDPALDPLRRALLGQRAQRPLAPASDPGGSARDALNKTFGEVLRSLEGAVFEATSAADRIRDVRRRGPRGSTFNPELMTLVTAAMDPPPRTPGGELLTLGDLAAIDPQVTFDNVGRRVSRLKLFRVLSLIRGWRHEHQLDPDEPMLKNPNALLRRLVRDGVVAEDLLIDPWGGTLQFVPASGPPVPFVTVIKGFELHAPGPDGAAGTGDDVRDPFERVVRSGTPYAKAMGEDRIVDARFELEVGDATVGAWSTLLEAMTGTSLGLGSVGTIGHGSGTGSGQGFGSGHGRLGGSHRSSLGVMSGVAWWSAPTRTDARGHVRFHVPLGDAETTWRIALVAVPDGARQATAHVDVPVALPLSARVETGATWVEGDTVDAAVTLRNRTGKPLHATLVASAGGVARIEAKDASRSADVAPGGAAVVRIPVAARGAGEAELSVTVQAPGLPDDVVRHRWQVLAAGEPTDLSRAQWVEGRATLAVPLGDDRNAKAPPFMRLVGEARLVLERGFEGALAGALDAMNPDQLGSREALVDAVEVASRIQRWAIAREGEGSATAVRAREIASRARGRLAAHEEHGASSWVVKSRLVAWEPEASGARHADCPPANSKESALSALEAEPAPESGAARACWDALVSSAVDEVNGSGDAVALARALLAVAEHPHRASLAATLVERLREKVALRPSGAITIADAQARDRSARATVFAALLRGARLGKPGAAPPERLVAWIGVQRDADGGYGSALATRAVVRALLASGLEEKGSSKAMVSAGALRREVEVPASGRVVVALGPAASSVDLEVTGPGLLARLERPAVRLWSHPPDAPESPIHLDLSWPADARAGANGVLSVNARHTRGRVTPIDLRIPLPPGVSLAEPVTGVRQVQGVLAIRRTLDPSGLPVQIDVPVRFGLSGRVTAPEARASVQQEELPRAVAPARPLTIK